MNPHGGEAARFSKPARRAVSGYLPYQWTHRESNSDFRHARAVSSRWTMSPSRSVDRPGNRTPISWLQARHLPVGRAAHIQSEVRLGIERAPPRSGGPSALPRRRAATAPTDQIAVSDPGWNRTITFLDVAQASLPLDHGIKSSVTEVGVEPTGTRLSTSSLCRFAYPVMSQ